MKAAEFVTGRVKLGESLVLPERDENQETEVETPPRKEECGEMGTRAVVQSRR